MEHTNDTKKDRKRMPWRFRLRGRTVKFLEKRNPKATRKSLVESIKTGAVGGATIGIIKACPNWVPTWNRLWMPLLMAAAFAFFIGVVHWQLPDWDWDGDEIDKSHSEKSN